ncbi:MAG: sodium-translocating pyrophosphatase [Caldivirga sp.]|jgi:K(+)-stimulated pyrophosphate-energized sodium pump
MINPLILTGLLAGLVGIVVAVFIYWWIDRQPLGDENMVRVWSAIREGATAYMRRQMRTIILFSFIISIIVALSVYAGYSVRVLPAYPELRGEVILESVLIGASVMLGSLASLAAAFLSMDASTRANVRTTEAAKRGTWHALKVAILGGSVLGFSVPSISVFSLALLFIVYSFIVGEAATPFNLRVILDSLAGFAFGASLSALFAQIGGGIYTKAADVGADLVGKVEAGIPEDDPRNPAVIADQVGDNVGDCAGRGADIFESVTAEMLGTMIVGWTVYFFLVEAGYPTIDALAFIFLPFLTGAVRVVATIPGVVVSAYQRSFRDPFEPLRNGVMASAVTAILGFFLAFYLLMPKVWVYFFTASLAGILAAIVIVLVTNYYTGREAKPVVEIAEASRVSPALTILQGLTTGMNATFIPIVVIAVTLLAAFVLGMSAPLPVVANSYTIGNIPIAKFIYGIYGTAAATLGMLSLAGIIMTLDGAGPITDNASGIAEMSELSSEVRGRLDPLDSIGNVTKALTKGYAMGSAALASLLLFQAFIQDYVARNPAVLQVNAADVSLSFSNLMAVMDYLLNHLMIMRADILIGILIGAMLPFLFSSLALRAVTKAAWYMVEEVRRQFRERPGILKGIEKPDYYRAVDISTQFALRNMITPTLSIILTPLIIGLLFGGPAVGALVIGATASGIVLAITMMWGGAAWDNAKKYIEAGHLGGKGSPAHAAAVIGDTVGDPLKDTAGPSLHIVIKLLNTISLVFIPIYMLWLLQGVFP